jgi:hypothetical protein
MTPRVDGGDPFIAFRRQWPDALSRRFLFHAQFERPLFAAHLYC